MLCSFVSPVFPKSYLYINRCKRHYKCIDLLQQLWRVTTPKQPFGVWHDSYVHHRILSYISNKRFRKGCILLQSIGSLTIPLRVQLLLLMEDKCRH